MIHTFERVCVQKSYYRNCCRQGNNTSDLMNDWPLHYTATRNSFDHQLLAISSPIQTISREKNAAAIEANKSNAATAAIATEYYFDNNTPPKQFNIEKYAIHQAVSSSASSSSSPSSPSTTTTTAYPVGVVTLHNVFTHDELVSLEQHVDQLSIDQVSNKLRQQTYHCTYRRFANENDSPTRTKFFFGVARYLWGGTDPDPLPHVAAGIRTCDCDMARSWMRKLELKLVDLGIIEPQFINQFAVNIYHDGSEGLAQHYDDAKRFAQPIISVRLFSDSRLSFGSVSCFFLFL